MTIGQALLGVAVQRVISHEERIFERAFVLYAERRHTSEVAQGYFDDELWTRCCDDARREVAS